MSYEPIVVFDGVCNFCSGFVHFVIKRDPEARFHFAPVQSRTGRRLMERHGLDPEDITTLLLIQNGRAHRRSDAVLRIAGQLAWPWKLARMLRVVPGPLRDWCYGRFARNRYRWFGKKAACMVPTPEMRSRFLE